MRSSKKRAKYIIEVDKVNGKWVFQLKNVNAHSISPKEYSSYSKCYQTALNLFKSFKEGQCEIKHVTPRRKYDKKVKVKRLRTNSTKNSGNWSRRTSA